jgi:hypothetical protein
MNAYENHENYLPVVRLVAAEKGGFHIKWDGPLRVTRTITIEVQVYGTDGYKAWAHNGKPIDEVEIYLKRRGSRRGTFVFEPGSVGMHVTLRRENYGAVKFVRTLTVEEVNTRTRAKFEDARPRRVHAAVQNFRIGDPQLLVLEAHSLNP